MLKKLKEKGITLFVYAGPLITILALLNSDSLCLSVYDLFDRVHAQWQSN